MKEKLRNGLLAGLGVISLGRKRFSRIYRDLIKEGESFKEESEFLKKNLQRFDAFTEGLEKLGRRFAERVNLATKDHLDKISEKIDRILKERKSQ